jgi:uncharacterized protein YbaP (TraB family)
MNPHDLWKAQEGLRDALRAADDLITNERGLIDNFARGRNYRDLAKVADELARVARSAEETRAKLDKAMQDESAIANAPR